ncbi:MAG: DUF6094 domain-containing protein, partial [Phototrophicaceae bacterium]
MARPESRIKAGYLPTEEHHYPAILSLLAPGNPDHRLLDPFAGEGEFLQAAAQAWNLTAYANELDRDRAAICAEKFGLERAVRGDVERLSASNAAFSVGWFNPPYDGVSGETKDNRRLEFKYLKHAWKWIAPQGVVLWVVYQSHLTDIALKFFSQNALEATIWALPGLHQGEYRQVIVAAVKGANPRPDDLLNKLESERENPCLLTVQAEPPYRLPALPKVAKFYFSPDEIDATTGAQLIAQAGAWAGAGFQALLHTPMPHEPESPVVTPRPGHLALALAGGLADGA